jgi:EAL domain-containing protein (putative c-di-GMP-specific phosphodiesterase class I)
VRWKHPKRGHLSPDRFVPFAEQTGLINPIGQWVLWEALEKFRGWQADFDTAANLGLTINVSAKQLDDGGFVADVRRALDDTGIDPGRLTLEITETVVMHTEPGLLESLKATGVRIAIDDFGTGYSSLSSLDRLPADVLKIDRSFVSRMQSERGPSPFIPTMVQLGEALGLDTVIEGIETKQELDQVRAFGARLGQGFFFAPPLHPEQVMELLAGRPGLVVDMPIARDVAEQDRPALRVVT